MGMINLDKTYQAYQAYSKLYDEQNEKIKLKIAHMVRVAKLNKRLAEQIGLDDEQVKLAELIGLLHDIGRFEQVKRFNTFIDGKSVKHADLGVQILFEEGHIREYIQDAQYDDVIKKAIYYHGRDAIGNEVQGLDRVHCMLIRDADKLDILDLLTQEPLPVICSAPEEKVLNGKIGQELYEDFLHLHKVIYSKRKYETECIACWLAYPFDINFEGARQMIKEKQYMDTIVGRFSFTRKDTREKVARMLQEVKQYIANEEKRK